MAGGLMRDAGWLELPEAVPRNLVPLAPQMPLAVTAPVGPGLLIVVLAWEALAGCSGFVLHFISAARSASGTTSTCSSS